MAINRLDFGTVPNPVSGDWTKLSAVVEKAFQNIYNPIQFVGTNIPQGTTFQVGGVIYYTASDTAITGTPSLYIKLTPNVGDSGATLDAAFVTNLSGVTWNKIHNGYYDASDNLYIFDESDSTFINTKVGQYVFPIGYVYTQYPTKDSPADMNFYGTWTNISSDFAGDFFRAEGGNAATFGTHQDDENKPHTHSYKSNAYANPTGGVYYVGGSGTGSTTGSSGNTEARPKNYAIRLWERTG